METSEISVLDRLFAPLVCSLTPDAARVIANFRVDRDTQAHIDELAGKCSDGRLTREERLEYEAYVEAIDTIAVLQDKAREALERSPES